VLLALTRNTSHKHYLPELYPMISFNFINILIFKFELNQKYGIQHYKALSKSPFYKIFQTFQSKNLNLIPQALSYASNKSVYVDVHTTPKFS